MAKKPETSDADNTAAIEKAARKWVDEFNSIPTAIIEKLFKSGDNIMEITPLDVGEDESDNFLPMWGTMWSFGDSADTLWLQDEENLKAMADCGFRIFEQDDCGYIFGIDGAGYDFYKSHWIPLYKARGLKWHETPSFD